jgi:hypothetical protein
MQDLPAVRPSEKSNNTPLAQMPIPADGFPANETDEPMDVEFRVIGESFPVGVLVAETYEPEGPWSPDSRIDRYLAPIRQAKLEAERQEQLKRLIEAQRRESPHWWTRLWRTISRRSNRAG